MNTLDDARVHAHWEGLAPHRDSCACWPQCRDKVWMPEDWRCLECEVAGCNEDEEYCLVYAAAERRELEREARVRGGLRDNARLLLGLEREEE